MSVTLRVEITGADETAATVQAIRNAIADRRPLHAAIAGTLENFTEDYLVRTPRHATAQRLGARPTGHRAKVARQIESGSDDAAAWISFPRSSGLGRAFGFAIIRPLAGRKFITIPATAETYGRQAGEWPRDAFRFAVIYTHRGPTPVLVWAESAGAHKKGDVAFWLRRMVYQRQDPTLLPSDDAYQKVARGVTIAYLQNTAAEAVSENSTSSSSSVPSSGPRRIGEYHGRDGNGPTNPDILGGNPFS